MRAVNNLYDICIKRLHKKGRFVSKDLTEDTENLAEQLVERMDFINEALTDLREIKARFEEKSKEKAKDNDYEHN